MKWLSYVAAAFLFFLLILVRYFESDLFYDPFLSFFKSNYRTSSLPEYDNSKLFLSLGFRYFLNTILSLGIIYFLFRKWKYLKFAMLIFIAFFIIFSLLYYWFLATEFEFGFTAGFYVRRFLIQPLLLLILVPAFYFMEIKQKESKIK